MSRARVYLNDPVTDREQLTEVTLHRPTDETGLLTSEWVQVFNCLNNDGGLTAMPMGFPFAFSFAKRKPYCPTQMVITYRSPRPTMKLIKRPIRRNHDVSSRQPGT